MEKYSLNVKDINKKFGNITAVKNFNLKVKDGEFVSLLGPSGCGKTTLLRIIAGFETPDSGEVFINDREISHTPPFRRPINMVFQRYALFPHMSVKENIAFSQFIKRRPRGEIDAKVKEMLRLVKLEAFGDRSTSQLSGGQAQRVALARALINEPQVLLLDEPLGALDLKIRKELQLELKNIQEQLKMIFLYVTHDQEEALVMSDRVVLMNFGEIIQVDTAERIYFHPNSKFSATFIGESKVFKGKVEKVTSGGVLVNINGLLIKTRSTKDVKVGDIILLAIRPERVRVVREVQSKQFDNIVKGKIQEVVFFGSLVKYMVKVIDKITIIALETVLDENELSKISKHSVGNNVTLGFMKDDVNILIR